MNNYPLQGYLRLKQIIGDPKAIPPVQPLIPISKSTWWWGVKNGRFPQPVKLGPRITVWTTESIAQYMDQHKPKEHGGSDERTKRTNDL